MLNTKIFIVGQQHIDKLKLAKYISEINEELEIAYTFISDPQYKTQDIDNNNYIYYLDTEEVNLSYKNNALLYIHNLDNKDYISKGITLDSFYNADIFCLDIEDFNNISDVVFMNNDILIIWLDTKHTQKIPCEVLIKDINESKYLIDRINNLNYLYFLDEDYYKTAQLIVHYLTATDNIKEIIREENS